MKKQQVKNLSQKVMLANLTISVWQATKFDKPASEEVREKHKAASSIGRYNKKLFPGEAASYKKVCQLGNAIRAFYYAQTMEYDQLGVRLLPAGIYLEYTQKLREQQREYDKAVEEFFADYDKLKADARLMLNGLFSESDYPSIENLRCKFGIKLRVLPFPDAEQFGVALPEADLISIRESINEQTQEAVDTAMKDLWTRLYDVVARMSERLSNRDNIFRDSLIENVNEICELLPKLNFAGDEKLEELRKRVEDNLTIHSPETLRDDPTTRLDTAYKAMEIQSAMAAFMGMTVSPFGDNASVAQGDGQLSFL